MTNENIVRDRLDQSLIGMTKEAVISLIDPRQVQLPEVQLEIKETDQPMIHFVFYGVLLFMSGYLVMFGNIAVTYIGYTIATLITPALLFAWLFNISSNKGERLPVYFLCFGWGAFSGIFAGVINGAIEYDYLQQIAAAFVEEPMKILGVYLLVKRGDSDGYFMDHLDGFLLGAAAGAGFTAVEDFSKVYSFMLTGEVEPNYVLLMRVLTALGHVFYSAIVGRSLGLAKAVKGRVTYTDLLPGLMVAILFHALWNVLESLFSLAILWVFMVFSFRRLVLQAITDKREWTGRARLDL